jgi:hypothetical protein
MRREEPSVGLQVVNKIIKNTKKPEANTFSTNKETEQHQQSKTRRVPAFKRSEG